LGGFFFFGSGLFLFVVSLFLATDDADCY